MNWSQNRLALIVALLLVTSAALFAVGTAIEHGQRDQHKTEVSAPSSTSGETGGESGEEQGHETGPSAGTGTSSEKIAGIDPESWPLVGLAIAISLALAAGLYVRRSRPWLVAAAGFAAVFAAGDIRELVHQLDESRTTVATIAGVLIALHTLAALVAVVALAPSTREDR
jgi:hypothetical protein